MAAIKKNIEDMKMLKYENLYKGRNAKGIIVNRGEIKKLRKINRKLLTIKRKEIG